MKEAQQLWPHIAEGPDDIFAMCAKFLASSFRRCTDQKGCTHDNQTQNTATKLILQQLFPLWTNPHRPTVAIRLFACNVHCDGLGTQLPCCMTQLRTDSSQNALLLEHVSAAFFVHVHVPAGYKHDSWRNRGSLCVCLSKLTRTVAHFAVWWVRLLCRICWVFVDFC